MIRLNTMLIKRGFVRPFGDKDYWNRSDGVQVLRDTKTISFKHSVGPLDKASKVYTFDRKDKEGVLRHIHTLEVKK